MHVQNLKKKMKINPHATVVPFIVMVDPEECPTIESFDVRKHDQYNYFVIAGSHLAEARAPNDFLLEVCRVQNIRGTDN